MGSGLHHFLSPVFLLCLATLCFSSLPQVLLWHPLLWGLSFINKTLEHWGVGQKSRAVVVRTDRESESSKNDQAIGHW